MIDVRRLLRFGAVGVANTAIYFGTYVALHTELPYLAAHVTAFAVAMVCSYFLNTWFTFRVRPRWRTFLLYPLSNLTNFVILTVGLQIAVGGFGLDSRWAPLPIALLAVPVTYVVTHYILTSGPDRAQGAGDGAGLPGNRSQGLGSRFRTRSPGNR